MNMPDPIVSMIKGAMASINEQRKHDAENMRLGQLIDKLESIDPEKTVITTAGTSVSGFDSYRGYYEDLAIEPDCKNWINVGELLHKAREARGEVFTGYKGGSFPMHDDSRIWMASYGNSGGIALAAIEERDYYVVLYGFPTSDC